MKLSHKIDLTSKLTVATANINDHFEASAKKLAGSPTLLLARAIRSSPLSAADAAALDAIIVFETQRVAALAALVSLDSEQAIDAHVKGITSVGV